MRIDTKYGVGQRVYRLETVWAWCPDCQTRREAECKAIREDIVERITIDIGVNITVWYHFANAGATEADVFATQLAAQVAGLKAEGK